MANLTVTPEGTLTIPKEFVQDIGMKPGGQVQLVILSNGSAILKPTEIDATFKKTGRIEDLAGFLAGKTDVKLTIEEMNEAIGDAIVEEFERRPAMRMIADTNLLVRLAVNDDARQTQLTQDAMAKAERVVVPCHALCEMVWVLQSKYHFKNSDIVAMVERIRASTNVELDRAAVDAGLAAMGAGADFADGVIAHEGRSMGGEMFVSFDKKVVAAVEKQGMKAELLG